VSAHPSRLPALNAPDGMGGEMREHADPTPECARCQHCGLLVDLGGMDPDDAGPMADSLDAGSPCDECAEAGVMGLYEPAPPEPASRVVDLMDALERSLAAAKAAADRRTP